jgi:D-alanine-D-alanine ligase-like ATP-grasp enzyme/ubiquinone/menaquinone biosynthesis C-methylase UbiE
MKVCVLISSYEGTSSPFEDHDEYPDPSRYINGHDFHLKFIKKQNAKSDIDEIYKEGFDIYFNFMWGQEYDNVAGIEALKYIEQKNVPILGTNSKFLSMTKVDFKILAQKYSKEFNKDILFPNYIIKGLDEKLCLEPLDSYGLKFPVITKLANACGSLHMSDKSLCKNEEELNKEVNKLIEFGKSDVIIEEYIVGEEYSVMIIETDTGVMALPPIKYVFSKKINEMQRFLHFDLKFSGMNKGDIRFEPYYVECNLSKKLKQTACDAYNSLNVHGCNYARVEMRVDNKGNIFVIEVNPMPGLFYPLGNKFGDDDLIINNFEGGHKSLFEIMVKNKMKSIKLSKTYDNFAESYDSQVSIHSNIPKLLNDIFKIYNYNGTILDLGCGTGIVGKTLNKCGHSIYITGVDISPKMMEKTNYDENYVGEIQNIPEKLEGRYFDHIICISVLHFLNNTVFEVMLMKMFKMATKSITISVENIPSKYNETLIKLGHECVYSHNNINVFDNVIVPRDWKLTYAERKFMWHSPATEDDIFGKLIIFQRV